MPVREDSFYAASWHCSSSRTNTQVPYPWRQQKGSAKQLVYANEQVVLAEGPFFTGSALKLRANRGFSPDYSLIRAIAGPKDVSKAQ